MISPSASTRLLVLLGNPVEHSLSPTFQNAGLRAAGLDAVYLTLRCSERELGGLMRGIALAGGGGNVTLPHKRAAVAHLDHFTSAVEQTGACNTFWEHGGAVWGDNTDVAGFQAAAGRVVESPLENARVLLIGAGGAARAALCTLIEERVAEVLLVNRTLRNAEDLAAEFAPRAAARGVRLHVRTEPSPAISRNIDLAINASSLGLSPDDPLPLPGDFPAIGAALDLVYTPSETRWVRQLRARGIPASDGLEMLLQQGAAAWQRWWKHDVPLAAMRAALPPRQDPPCD